MVNNDDTSIADRLRAAVEAAQAARWDDAHAIAQRHEGDARADWLHAILHKMEPDAANARYWYGRCGRRFDDFADGASELDALRAHLEADHR